MRNFMVGLLIGACLVVGVAGWLRPDCPSEDSCKPAFETHWYGNGWTAKEDTP